MNLHDWIDELCDVLDIETELDEALVLDLARDAAHNVERRAAPISTYLLGFAAGASGASVEKIEELAGAASQLALGWDRPADAADPTDVAVEIEVDEAVELSDDELADDEVED
ncbi:DUF6457 domain-containing protein [Nocardioides houyundeii]|uniref:DUF6457 domain-containing protein n=1 Tax=Nocardioides houyundeii TaxID=2045452 RepID=UPI000C7893B2|nr:DUF6457 domain-containing protein [Nocardioides houyundeii]